MPINLLDLMKIDYKEEFSKELESKFILPTKFAQEIESIVKNEGNMSYIDAILYYCEKNKIEIESVPKLISKPLKEKIKYEAMELNFLKKTSRARLNI